MAMLRSGRLMGKGLKLKKPSILTLLGASNLRACYVLDRVCAAGKKAGAHTQRAQETQKTRKAVWLFQTRDEQRRDRAFLPATRRAVLPRVRLRRCGSLIWNNQTALAAPCIRTLGDG